MQRILLFIFMLVWAVSVQAMDLEPYTYRQDFETHELGAWSSYPPTQDTAYEAPYIHPGKILPSDEGTVLRKIIWPLWNEPHLTGVVKRLKMRLDNKSRIQFRYYIKTTVDPTWLGIDLPLANGDRIRSKFSNPTTNQWVTVNLDIKAILTAAGRASEDYLDISALAIMVRFENADTDMPFCLGFDDFSVSGYREASFTYFEPKTVSLDEWDDDIAMKHYHYGDDLTIRGTFKYTKPDQITVTIDRFDRPLKKAMTFRLTLQGDSWVTSNPVKLNEKTFQAGMYEVTITGTRNKESVARSKFTFIIVDESMLSVHPRIWFEKKGIEDFKAVLNKENNKTFLEYIRKDAANARENFSPEVHDDLHLFPTDGWVPNKSWLEVKGQYDHRIAVMPDHALTNALVYVIDGNQEAAEWAKKCLVSLCTWDTWTHPWMVNKGHKIYLRQSHVCQMAVAYDILYDLLTESERGIVREGFIRNALKTSYQTYVVMDQVTNEESNWISGIVGGTLVAACSIMGDVASTSDLEPYLSGCLLKYRTHLNTVYEGDSGIIEDLGYGLGAMAEHTMVMPVLEKVLNIDMGWKLDKQYIEAIWAADNENGLFFGFGDPGLYVTKDLDTVAFPFLLEKYRDPELAWFYDLNPPTPSYFTLHTLLFDIDDIPRKKPDISGAKWFKTTGTVVYRTEIGPEPFVLTFKCGPFGNHQHIDRGTFFLADRGKLFITEQNGSSYYGDYIYQSHIIQPVGHNCILVDNNPMSQRTGDHQKYAAGMTDYARITSFVAGDDISFALGDLTPVYLGNVKSLERGILYVQPRTVLVVDRLRTRSGEASMDILFHSPKFSDTALKGNNAFTIRSDDITLTGTVVCPENPDLSLTEDTVKQAMFTNNPIEPLGRVTVTTRTKGGKAITVTHLSTDNDIEDVTDNDSCALVTYKGVNVIINKGDGRVEGGGIVTDGLLAAVTDQGAVFLGDGTVCSTEGKMMVSSNVPLTILIEGDTISYSTLTDATIQVQHKVKIRTVLLQGKKLKQWEWDSATGLVSFVIPSGQGSIELQ